ncbi:hypothetical protein BV25DRAFT_1915735 [Artomyces pyxidatus]|uniref:Uncharacterized protein n=1 Tax=Artomyces pyxidatus TaxID=48021 RepID=A0ACB8T2N0_9AGAM|nr:hypothetical protein BV25DRAFT_1915735 [Artomyces pyxidatus]
MLVGLLSLGLLPIVSAQTWCGKVYMANETVVPPGGQFPVPVTSTSPLLALRCNPVLRPFLPDDLATPASNGVIVDALVRYSHIAGAQPLALPSAHEPLLHVSIALDGRPLASGTVPLNGSVVIPFALAALEARLEPYNLTCTATLPSSAEKFSSVPTTLTYLPTPPPSIGSVTKLDLRSGALLAKAVHQPGPYEAVFPLGFYTNFGGYLEGNDTVVEVLKSQGINVIHPIPTFDNLTAFNLMVDKMEQLGIWLMYDMRWTYMNATAVTEEVTPLRNRTNLLLYYTGDEPDGSEDPMTAPARASALLNELDPYRPSSLVLNCYDYYFSEYAAGTPIVMQDTYPIGINATYSVEWNTPCTDIKGDCGCDDCVGDFEDIRVRMELFAERLEALGWERGAAVWTVPQGFGGSEYWSRAPTGAEWLVQNIISLNAGALGSISWNDPTTDDIKAAASALSFALPSLTPFILSSPLASPPVQFRHVVTSDRLDFGVWTKGAESLVVAANLNYFSIEADLSVVGLKGKSARTVFNGGARFVGDRFEFGSVQSGAWIFGV